MLQGILWGGLCPMEATEAVQDALHIVTAVELQDPEDVMLPGVPSALGSLRAFALAADGLADVEIAMCLGGARTNGREGSKMAIAA